MFAAIEDKQDAIAVNEGEDSSHRILRREGGMKTER